MLETLLAENFRKLTVYSRLNTTPLLVITFVKTATDATFHAL